MDCNTHEKQWKQFCVDINLEDEWLEELNSLKYFDLHGICEGHSSDERCGFRGKEPYIFIRLRASNRSLLKNQTMNTLYQNVVTVFKKEFPEYAYQASLKIRVNYINSSSEGKILDFCVNLRPRKKEIYKETSLWRDWFENSIKRIKSFETSWSERTALD